MSLGGWLILSGSVGGVSTLFLWCIWKVLTASGEAGRLHGFEREPPDKE